MVLLLHNIPCCPHGIVQIIDLHLVEIDTTCDNRMDNMIPAMMKREGVTEELKASDPMAWVGRMNSIHNRAEEIILQKQMLEAYAAQHGFGNIFHYTDDGWSGGSFDRPDWKHLIADIEAGKVGCVIAKDMSRIGRDYLQTGFYTDV